MGKSVSIKLEDGTFFTSAKDFCKAIGIRPETYSRSIAKGLTAQQLKDKAEAAKKVIQDKIHLEFLSVKIKEAILHSGRHIIDFPNLYALPDGRIFNIERGKYLTGSFSGNGYLRSNIKNKSGKGYVTVYHHVLVCKAFHGEKPLGQRITVDHIDRDKLNNKPENLRWCEQKENNRNRGNHTYHTYNGETLLLSQWEEKLKWSKTDRAYIYSKIFYDGMTLAEALEQRNLYVTGGTVGRARWIEIPSEVVTGYYFPSAKAARVVLKIGTHAQLKRYLSAGISFEKILERCRHQHLVRLK